MKKYTRKKLWKKAWKMKRNYGCFTTSVLTEKSEKTRLSDKAV